MIILNIVFDMAFHNRFFRTTRMAFLITEYIIQKLTEFWTICLIELIQYGNAEIMVYADLWCKEVVSLGGSHCIKDSF